MDDATSASAAHVEQDVAAAARADAMVADLFDNEALWDADDTDEFILVFFRDLEAAGAQLTKAKDIGWNSLLHMAALWNRRAIMEEIVRRGADVNAKNKNGHTPLDLATHWGHFELALQLQHYGGKHTCESERDIAISQRDLAQQRNKESDAEMHDALQRLKCAKQEREAIRVERDRLLTLHSEVVRTCSLQADQLKLMDAAIGDLTAEKHTLRVQAAQLADELSCEQAARNNAVQGWKIAEDVIAELQRAQEACREREEEALALRNEALDERDASRALARQAQLDQGIAKQHQMNAERERDRALKQLLDAESGLARDKELCDAQLARVELERRTIQSEIDRQTELLRSENSKLEKQIGALAAANARQQQEIEEMSAAMTNAHKQLALQQRELASAKETAAKSDEQVRVLLDERRDEHRAWRQRIEQNLQQAIASELRAMLEAAVATWRKLHECQELVFAFDVAALAARFQLPESSTSSSLGSSTGGSLGLPPRQGAAGASTASAPSLKPVLLPAIQDKSAAGSKDASLTPRAQPGGNNTPPNSFVSHNYDPPLRFVHDPRVQSRLRAAEDALQVQLQSGAAQNLSSVAEHVTALCTSIASYLDALTKYTLKHLTHFRKQASAHEKMIERKDELLQRFTQHRQEKLKKPNPAARFRECSVRPSV